MKKQARSINGHRFYREGGGICDFDSHYLRCSILPATTSYSKAGIQNVNSPRLFKGERR